MIKKKKTIENNNIKSVKNNKTKQINNNQKKSKITKKKETNTSKKEKPILNEALNEFLSKEEDINDLFGTNTNEGNGLFD